MESRAEEAPSRGEVESPPLPRAPFPWSLLSGPLQRAVVLAELHQGTAVPQQLQPCRSLQQPCPWQPVPAEAEGLCFFSWRAQHREPDARGQRGLGGLSPPGPPLASAGDAGACLGCPGRRLCLVSLGLSPGPIPVQRLRPSRCLQALGKGLPERPRTPGTCPTSLLHGGSQVSPDTGLAQSLGPLPTPLAPSHQSDFPSLP